STEGRLVADISDSDPARDPVREQGSDRSSVDAVTVAAANEPAARSSEGIEDTPNPMEPLQSQLALGPLANHPAGRLLDSYHESIERGDLAGLLDMLAPNAVEAGLGDRSAFEASYRELFESSRERGLTLKVLHARRQDRGWLVRTDYQLEMVRSDSGDVERVRREVEYSMTEDNGRLRIAAISY
ncbi:MAG: hypothetical protein V2J10_04465, partial [Wenzhouxiangella sp.]|nr:hypothetical protein [Wenzhouxiangella sp.]